MPGWNVSLRSDLAGKRAIVTGGNAGLGFEVALQFAGFGMSVVLACRDAVRAESAADEIRARQPGARVEVGVLDVADLASVREFAAAYGSEPVDILVNNAGVMAIPRATSPDGFELQLASNHLGHFALTGLLLPALLAREGARVVAVTSSVARIGRIDFDDLQGKRRYSPWGAYGQSKLANLLFARELDRRVPGVLGVAAHPGYARTGLQLRSATENSSRVMAAAYRIGNLLIAQSAREGALPLLYAATAEHVVGGTLYGPRGLGQMRGRPSRVSMALRDGGADTAARLWAVSADLTGVNYPDKA
ncbi:short-chain dehydrogenase [Acrocarpospora pleiomorpha]|uniref:Short-chain dehydrogenase n=1 Tax=Acrocarpospora pleiomorpha TaxID=90975 RepID=A0A5M3Y0H8_9ACTN|nr:oxidoreductase [Acrocarpospora pleiomorpha]GES26750.1 short-chain dehydrogenase [Acrocarpospora pleiomorpha]